jgi:N utilization substance protein B
VTRAASKDTSKAAGRREARLAAVQALYQIEMTGAAAEDVLLEFLQHRLGQDNEEVRLEAADRELFCELVRGAAAERDDLDDMLAAVLDEDWPVERLETLLCALLRAGAYEISARLDTPARAIIKEYLAVADAFFGAKEPAMVNGVLDRLARTLRTEEFEATASVGAGPGRG